MPEGNAEQHLYRLYQHLQDSMSHPFDNVKSCRVVVLSTHKNITSVRFSTKNQRKAFKNTVFCTFLRFVEKTRKNRILDRSPARIDFSLVGTPFWDDFLTIRGREHFETILA
jgi:hypothetical protein